MSRLAVAVAIVVLLATFISAQQPATDTVAAVGGNITIVPIGHGSVQLLHGSHSIWVDVVGDGPPPPPGVTPKDPERAAARVARLKPLKPPTLILVTDIHGDHLDHHVIETFRSATTTVLLPAAAAKNVPNGTVIANGETKTVNGITVQAIPMYNLQRGPQPGQLFHDKGRGNGYIVTLGGKRVYLAGDTECTPEMKALTRIDVAFLPMNLPYTMTPLEAAECAKAFKPAVVYPYHDQGQDPNVFANALAGTGIEVRLRDWYAGSK
jgi:L-ascorbate metabolism protein UlaG (beta-lactamase superfamily)